MTLSVGSLNLYQGHSLLVFSDNVAIPNNFRNLELTYDRVFGAKFDTFSFT